jgi:hypothetical protein
MYIKIVLETQFYRIFSLPTVRCPYIKMYQFRTPNSKIKTHDIIPHLTFKVMSYVFVITTPCEFLKGGGTA